MSAVDAYWAAPPVSRTLTALTLVTSILVHSGLLSGHRIVFYLPWIFKFPLPELWRLFTPFWLTGGGLSLLFDTVFLWQYSSGLELESSRFSQPGDYFTYIVFLGLIIMTTSGLVLGGVIFTQALVLGMAYTFSQDNKNKKVSFFIISFQALYLPWAILGLTLVLGGADAALQQGTGLIAAHLYDFLTRLWPTFGGGRNYIRTPSIVKRWFGADQRGVKTKGYGTAYRPASQETARGTSTGFSFSDSWNHRGAGHRLGGE